MASTIASGKWAWAAVVALTLPVGLAAACSAGNDGDPIPVGAGGSGTGGGIGGAGTGGVIDPNCIEQPCKLTAPQCGCAEGERCTIASMPTTRACLPNGDKNVTEGCGECVAGSMCMDNGTGAPPLCHQFCAADAECGGPGALCIIDVGGIAKVCTHACDPVAKSGCAEPSTKCDLFQETADPQRWYTLCGAAGPGTQGDACTVTTECANGFACVPVNTGMMLQTLCAEWCNVATPTCPVGTCEPFSEPVLVGTIEYGVCIP
jgi:hypothetical protein